MKWLTSVLFVAVLLVSAAAGFAQPGLELTNSWDGITLGNHMTIAGERIYFVASGGLYSMALDEPDPAPVQIYTGAVGDDLAVRGGLLVASRGYGGVRLFDVSDPDNAQLLTTLRTPGVIHDLAFIDDQHVLLAAAYSGFIVLDVSVPSDPQFAHFLPVAGGESVVSLDIAGERALAAVEGLGALLLDVSDPLAPVPLDTTDIETGDFGAVLAMNPAGDAAASFNERYIFPPYDLPFYVATLQYLTIAPDGDLAVTHTQTTGPLGGPPPWAAPPMSGPYVFANMPMLSFYDYSDPGNPLLVDDDGYEVKSMALLGDRLFVLVPGQLREYAVTWPEQPTGTPVPAYEAPEDWSDARPARLSGEDRNLAGELAAQHRQDRAITELDEIGFDSLSTTPMPHDLAGMAQFGDLLVAWEADSLSLTDIGDPESPEVLSVIEQQNGVAHVHRDGDRLYVGMGAEGIEIYDIADPAAPALLATMADIAGNSFDVTSDTMYVASGGELRGYDLADPDDPQLFFQWANHGAREVARHGDWLLLSDVYSVYFPHLPPFSYTETSLFSLTMLDQPYLVKKTSTQEGEPEPVSLTEGYLLTRALDVEFAVYKNDLYTWTDPFYPQLVLEQDWDMYAPPDMDRGFWRIAQQDSLLLAHVELYHPNLELQLYDVSDPFTLAPLDTLAGIESTALGFPVSYVSAQRAVTAWRIGELDAAVNPVDAAGPPTRFTLAPVHPNPFNATARATITLPAPGQITLQVFDLTGRRVATLAQGERSAGRHTILIDGSDWASGVYFVRAELPGTGSRVRRVTLLK